MTLGELGNKSVYVGLSGGVDSAVTAALLKDAGARITGVFIKGWYPSGLTCTWRDDRRDAMRVAAHLGIPFQTLEAGQEYKQSVIDYLLREYRAGRTPNPDIMCNREVKFGAFYRFAREQGADYIATGHYAQLSRVGRDVRLLRGADERKDQSYFLWAVPEEALANTLFPLGGMRKEEVRALARKYRLPNADKKDSQGICFLGDISIEDFLKTEMDTAPGKAVDENGREVGGHDGAILYTLGERVGLRNAQPGPWYVLRKDLASNTLAVSTDKKQHKSAAEIALSDTNWFREPRANVEAQYRYHGQAVRGSVSGNAFIPAAPLPEALAPGQSLVVYEGNECVGGGIIS